MINAECPTENWDLDIEYSTLDI